MTTATTVFTDDAVHSFAPMVASSLSNAFRNKSTVVQRCSTGSKGGGSIRGLRSCAHVSYNGSSHSARMDRLIAPIDHIARRAFLVVFCHRCMA
eukprot:CAMPEP_0195069710 /NCGR_PEP_ID=MMETSP0448-20130528/13952_1 /TAXON_ID=66468 /ORGANISM="Heterocapsa triquestra, Strain CCMP 448" /LENGTH=93 /DNA_ID=CAMNT_0040101343 /DNA_START=63 /DNA_END=345 /DNA_ORIENTATION=-